MKGYLGEFETEGDITKEKAMLFFLSRYSYIDGEHHKSWLIDQLARIIMDTPIVEKEARWENGETELRITTGEPSEKYIEWINGDHEDVDIVGIAP